MWQKALDALPTEEKLSEMEKHLKQQYESGLKASNVAAGRRENKLPENFQVRNDTCNFPWEVASQMLDGLKRTNDFSSSVRLWFFFGLINLIFCAGVDDICRKQGKSSTCEC